MTNRHSDEKLDALAAKIREGSVPPLDLSAFSGPTEGEWGICEHAGEISVYSGIDGICHLDENEADHHLIASAPTLLRLLWEHHEALADALDQFTDKRILDSEGYANARAALAKVKV